MNAAPIRPYDEALLRRAFDVAKRSHAGGDHPFGAVLAEAEGNALMDQSKRLSTRGLRSHRPRRAASRVAGCARALVFAAGQPATDVVGPPLLEEEAAALQADFWRALN